MEWAFLLKIGHLLNPALCCSRFEEFESHKNSLRLEFSPGNAREIQAAYIGQKPPSGLEFREDGNIPVIYLCSALHRFFADKGLHDINISGRIYSNNDGSKIEVIHVVPKDNWAERKLESIVKNIKAAWEQSLER